MNRWRAAVAWPLLAAALAANAQTTIYRCGHGVFSQAPCTGGDALVLDAAAPDAQARRAALDAARRDAELAQRLTRERQSRAAEGFWQRSAAGLHTAPRRDPADDETPPRASRRGKAAKPAA